MPARAQDLSAEERAFARAQPPVTMCVDPDWRPYEWIDERGIHRGIAADLLRLVARRVGLQLQLVPTADWQESLAASRAGRCRILSFLNRTAARDAWLRFTAPVFSDPNVFVTREEHRPITDPADLRGEIIVFPSGTAMEERFRRDYPGVRVAIVESEDEALAWVTQRRADATLRSRTVAAHVIRAEGLFNLKIAGELPGYANHLRIGVAADDPVLRDVLDRGVASLSRAEVEEIVNRHVVIAKQDTPDYELVLRLLAGFAAVAAVGGAYHVRLRRLHRELVRVSRTDALTGLANRARIDAELERELERSRRHRRDFAIVMLDIDAFKAVNDRFGHAEGDRALKAVAGAIAASVRMTDLAGRWGGEEFLILCPETGEAEARAVAERVRLAVRSLAFPEGRVHTVSAGVAALQPGDDADGLLRRADAGLYRAKHGGRDRVGEGA